MRVVGRRVVMRCGLIFLAMLVLSAHTPYRQWEVYRMKHLLIGTSREDAASYAVGKQLAESLSQAIPESRARVARARTVERLGSLIATDQLQVLLVSQNHLSELAQGTGPFKAFGPIAIVRLFRFDDLVLVARADFPARHAWIITHAFLDNAEAFGGTPPQVDDGAVPVHPGVLAALNGEESPGEEVAERDGEP
jgi:hypothetical protein